MTNRVEELSMTKNQNTAITAATVWLRQNKVKGLLDNKFVAIDMQAPSYEKRMFLVEDGIIKESYICSHGVNTSDSNNRALAKTFSNKINSRMSSLGAMMTTETYIGKHGLSLKLTGLEKGINDNVEKRHIVIHGADYCSESYIKLAGRAGQSWGCPAVDKKVINSLIKELVSGTLVYIHY